MTIKQQGGIFGRHPVFADVEAEIARLNQITEETANAGVTIEGVLLKDKNLDVASNANQLTISPSDRATYGRLDIGHFTNGAFIGTYAGTNTASGVIRFGTSGTEHLRLEGGNVKINTGNLVIGTSGKGIDFSATSGTGTSELFDDYEEGTWTPTLTGSTGAPTIGYQTQDGFYTKVGRLVTAQIYLQFNTVSGGSGNIQISLPFAAANTNQGAANVFCYNITHPNTYISGFINPNTATLTPFGSGSNATWAANTIADLKASAVQAYAITAQYYVA